MHFSLMGFTFTLSKLDLVKCKFIPTYTVSENAEVLYPVYFAKF